MSSTNSFKMPFSSFSPELFAKYMPQAESMETFARDAFSASTESTRASVKGMQEVSSVMMRQMKDAMTLSVDTGRQLSEASSLEDAMNIQASYFKSALEANMKGLSELSELYTDTVQEAFAPLAKSAKTFAEAANAD